MFSNSYVLFLIIFVKGCKSQKGKKIVLFWMLIILKNRYIHQIYSDNFILLYTRYENFLNETFEFLFKRHWKWFLSLFKNVQQYQSFWTMRNRNNTKTFENCFTQNTTWIRPKYYFSLFTFHTRIKQGHKYHTQDRSLSQRTFITKVKIKRQKLYTQELKCEHIAFEYTKFSDTIALLNITFFTLTRVYNTQRDNTSTKALSNHTSATATFNIFIPFSGRAFRFLRIHNEQEENSHSQLISQSRRAARIGYEPPLEGLFDYFLWIFDLYSEGTYPTPHTHPISWGCEGVRCLHSLFACARFFALMKATCRTEALFDVHTSSVRGMWKIKGRDRYKGSRIVVVRVSPSVWISR